jgi:ABC-type uncharacterized transport system substrate-binding protein
MSLKIFCLTLCALLFALCVSAEAQQQAKIAKIGWLGARPSAIATGLKLLTQDLRKLGYVEGKNITFESRYAEGKYERLAALADELVRLKVDVLVTPSDVEALAAKNITSLVPIVFLEVSDPVAAGLVDSLARPGGNLTGFTSIAPVLSGKRGSYSRKPFRSSLAWPCCGIRAIPALCNNGMKISSRHGN